MGLFLAYFHQDYDGKKQENVAVKIYIVKF